MSSRKSQERLIQNSENACHGIRTHRPDDFGRLLKEAALRRIEIKIRLNVPESSAILNDISRLIERYLKRNKIEFHSIDARVKFDDDE